MRTFSVLPLNRDARRPLKEAMGTSAMRWRWVTLVVVAAGLAAVGVHCTPFGEADPAKPDAGDDGGVLTPGDAGDGFAHPGNEPQRPLPVRCNSGTCSPPKSVCCTVTYNDTDYRNGTCETSADCQTDDYFACQSELNCALGRVCCVVRLPDGEFTQTECAEKCVGDEALCEPNQSGGCPAGKLCAPSKSFPKLFDCQ